MHGIPAAYRGLWRRRVLETPTHIDRTTCVYWLQTGSLYADLRVPADRAPDDAYALAAQQGFAGRLRVDGDVLSWDRWLDYQPPAAPDVGRVHFDGALLVEHGVHADYREEWERVAPWDEDSVALALDAELDAHGRTVPRAGVLVALAGYFVHALARWQPLPAAPSLRALLDSPTYTPHEKAAFLDCAIDFGTRDADAWRVSRSTLPVHERRGLVELHGPWRRIGSGGYLQSPPGGGLRRWRVIECGATFCGLPQAR